MADAACPSERDVEALWQRDHAAYPGMAKATFVRNCLFNGDVSPSCLGSWILDQDDLADQVWEGGCDSYRSMTAAPAPDGAEADGKTWYRADPDGPRVIVRIQMETLHSGESKLLRRERDPWEDYCDA